jgi:hypothetical protein
MEVDVYEAGAVEVLLASNVVDAEITPSGFVVFTRRNGEEFTAGSITGVWEDYSFGDGVISMKYMKVGETCDIDFRLQGGSTTAGNGSPFYLGTPHEPSDEGIFGGIVLPCWYSSPDTGGVSAFARLESIGPAGGAGQVSFYAPVELIGGVPTFTGGELQAITGEHMVEFSELKLQARFHIHS